MPRLNSLTSTSTLAVAALAAVASAEVTIGDFEGADPGQWGYWSSGLQTPLGDDPTLEFSAEDATSGAMSVKATNMGYDQNLAYAADFDTRQDFLNNNTLLFDVVFPETTDSGFWELFEIVFNSDEGFNDLTASVTNSEGGTNQVGWGSGGGARRVVTFSVDYSSQLALWNGEDMSYLELVISLNNDSVHNVAYLDNFRLVPAPASIAMLGLGLAGATRRRR
ncbi:MAG: hypothetical protein CMJ31_14750 [Phycisphaerae bacterium]|nr:hypothetical protein [Phycisphaerae bacterium]